MKRLQTFAIALMAALLVGCAGGAMKAPSPNAVIESTTQLIDSYVDAASAAHARGRITPDQADKAKNEARTAHKRLMEAKAFLTACAPKAPCTEFDNLIRALNQDLYKLEAELRKEAK
jgi:hypothetical protein